MRKEYRVPYRTKEFIKNELYHYWDNKRIFDEEEMDIIEESPPPADGQPKGNKTGKPTESKAIRIINKTSTRRLLTIDNRLRGIEKVFKMLVPEEMEVVDLIFKEGKSQIYTEMNNNISKDTYYNTMNKTIWLVAKEFGEI